MPILKPLWRGLRVTEHLLTGSLIAGYVAGLSVLGRRPRWTPRAVTWWHGRLCRSLGLRVQLDGALHPNALLVANHVSWLDIPVLGAHGQIGFLSKAEVRNWPLIGWLAETAGTLFIARGANQTAEAIARIGARIGADEAVVIFPEGTTTDGTRLHRFHPRLFAAAQQAGIQVQPVALRYGTNGQPDRTAPFIGDDALLPHLLRVLGHPELRVKITPMAPIAGATVDRRELADRCRHRIAGALGMDDGVTGGIARNGTSAEGQRGPGTPEKGEGLSPETMPSASSVG